MRKIVKRLTGGNAEQRGMVTVELAMSLIALMLATLAGLWTVWVLGQQMRCIDTAGEVARQIARGDRAAAARAAERRPAGATVTSRHDGRDAVVEVRLTAHPFRALPAVPLTAEARVALEPGEA